jgi:hypothetical protein
MGDSMLTIRVDFSLRTDRETVATITPSRRASHGAIAAIGRLPKRKLRERFVDADSSAIS